MKSILDYVHEREIGSAVWLTAANLDATPEQFHDAVCPFVEKGHGDGFVVTGVESESHSGYPRHDGGIGRYTIVYCERVA